MKCVDHDCPKGFACYGNTRCYYDGISMTPLLESSLSSTTLSSSSSTTTTTTTTTLSTTRTPTTTLPDLQKESFKLTIFCGKTWSWAHANCSFETHCISNDDCEDGDECFNDLPGCSLLYTKDNENSIEPFGGEYIGQDRNHISQNRFCGSNLLTADKYCTLDRHCPGGSDSECPPGTFCFSFLPSCNAYDMKMALHSEQLLLNPTTSPTIYQSREPITDMPSIKVSLKGNLNDSIWIAF